MAAKQAHRIMHECRRAAWCRAGVMALQLVECGDERSRIAGQFERRCICIQFANARQGESADSAFSFVASCQRAGVEPFAWFKDVLSRINSQPINRIAELLPHNWAPA